MNDSSTSDLLFKALVQTWPAAKTTEMPPFTLRHGAGGGKRVSAATANDPADVAEIHAAAGAMQAMGQSALFMIRTESDPLDAVLADLGYRVVDPTVLRAAPVELLATLELPRVAAFTIWEPLQVMRDIWAEGGIDAARISVMERAPEPKTGLLSRSDDKPSGAGFVAVHGAVAMVHALETRATARRQGAARYMMIAAAKWAKSQGATQIAVAVTQANIAANALYASLEMPICAKYHYRIKD